MAQLSGVDGRWQWVSTAGGYGGPGGTGYPFSDDDTAGDVQVLDNEHLLVSGAFCQGARLGDQIGPLATTTYDGFLARITRPLPCPDSLAAAAGVQLVADSADCQAGSRTLRVLGAPAGSAFAWNTGATGPSLAVTAPGRYEVRARTLGGCGYRLGYTVTAVGVALGGPLPNVITPNGDGLNDRWVVPGLLAGTRLRLYNRWGRLVYQTAAYANEWAAAGAPAGLYYYVLENEQLCASPRIKGWVEVIR
ncbi:gliding motility-associated C-terminal domain-containing protein [Hymenobacter coccineus]|uniref:T9SS type B sorting domain-containing protein n=1 Tax=Hymenobacter coccineus TaxID=1908235 RepID=UPI001955E5D5|nr:gliding motility-associated C-terminal domain-containing protein [Hymenobacter coccineus]